MNVTRVRVEMRRHHDDDDPRRSLESLMRAFKRAVDQCGVIHECKERRYYEKPSAKRRRKLRERAYKRELEKREASGRIKEGKGNRKTRKFSRGTDG